VNALVAVILAGLLPWPALASGVAEAGARADAAGTVTIRWFGQACFLASWATGGRVVFDPCDQSFLDYRLPADLRADIVCVSHEHADHNNVKAVHGSPVVLRGHAGVRSAQRAGVSVRSVDAWHDEVRGAERGANTIYLVEKEGLRLCHLGDLGQVPTDAQVSQIGEVDVLFLPVGGHFTLDPSRLDDVVARLKPKVIIPMHYRTWATRDLPLASVDDYLRGRSHVRRESGSQVDLAKGDLTAGAGSADATLIVLEPPRGASPATAR